MFITMVIFFYLYIYVNTKFLGLIDGGALLRVYSFSLEKIMVFLSKRGVAVKMLYYEICPLFNLP